MLMEWRFSISVASVVIFNCITCVNCIGYRTAESRISGSSLKNQNAEYDKNCRIQVFHNGRVINDTISENGRVTSIEVVVTAFRETFVLDLKLNRYLFASSYVEKSITNLGVIYHPVKHTEDHCYYIGTLRNRNYSSAAVSTCKGIVGYFDFDNFSYHVEPRSDRLNRPHVVYRIRENSDMVYGCGAETNDVYNGMNFFSTRNRLKRAFNWPQDGDKKDKVVELYIANDNSQFISQGRDANAVFQRAKSIANFASSSYQTLGIYFVLVGMEVWTDSDRFPVERDAVDAALSSWYRYRAANIIPFHYNDNAVLITNVKFSNEVVGKAIIGLMCSYQSSGAVIVDLNSAATTGSTMAHEIGHNFGLVHDISTCSCPDSASRCIMAVSVNPRNPATNWSSCSLEQFNVALQTGADSCLYDVPQTVYDSSVSTCGNGIIEQGEQCDCGSSPKQECNFECCNTTTCQLKATASCASGRCCDITRCQILEDGSVCRRSAGTCDLTEFCDGTASTCPVDTYKPDGTNCTINGDFAFCYNGACRTHNSQCELIFGSGVRSSDIRCYYTFNVNGVHYGNCGFNWLPAFNVSFIPCERKDSMCGKLMCDIKDQQLFRYKSYYMLSQASVGSYTCNSVIFDYGTRVQDPGLVPNGAACGDGKMCVSQKCINVSSLGTKLHDDSCNGDDEMLNNLGICQSLTGPSKSSSSDGPNVGLIVGLCILFIIIIPALILLAVFGYMHRQRLMECFSQASSKWNPRAGPKEELPSVSNGQYSQNNRNQQPLRPAPNTPAFRTQVPSLSRAPPSLSSSSQPTRSAPLPPTAISRPPLPSIFTITHARNAGYNNHGSDLTATDDNNINEQYEEIQQLETDYNNSRNQTTQQPIVTNQRPAPPAKPRGLRSAPSAAVRPAPPPRARTNIDV